MMSTNLLLSIVIFQTLSIFVKSLKALEECPNGHIVNDTQYECHYGPQSVFEYLIYPKSTMEFIKDYFQKQPVLITRSNSDYYNIPSFPFSNVFNLMLDSLDYRSVYDGTHPEITITAFHPNETEYYLMFPR